MIATYYCPKCQQVRQFITEDIAPVTCGYRKMITPVNEPVSFEACDGVLMNVKGIHFIIRDPNA